MSGAFAGLTRKCPRHPSKSLLPQAAVKGSPAVYSEVDNLIRSDAPTAHDVSYTNLRSVILISHDPSRSGGLAPISANLKGQQSPDGQNQAAVRSYDPIGINRKCGRD